jgi:hypothetical protein
MSVNLSGEKGDFITNVSNQNIDVSNDGKKWLHLIGPQCLEKLPSFYSLRKCYGKDEKPIIIKENIKSLIAAQEDFS